MTPSEMVPGQIAKTLKNFSFSGMNLQKGSLLIRLTDLQLLCLNKDDTRMWWTEPGGVMDAIAIDVFPAGTFVTIPCIKTVGSEVTIASRFARRTLDLRNFSSTFDALMEEEFVPVFTTIRSLM